MKKANRKILCILMPLILGLAACGASDGGGTENVDGSDALDQSVSEDSGGGKSADSWQPETVSLTDSKIHLIDHHLINDKGDKSTYLAFAAYIPEESYYRFESKSSSDVWYPNASFFRIPGGWGIVESADLPENLDLTDTRLVVELYHDGMTDEYAIDDWGEPMSDAELDEIGLKTRIAGYPVLARLSLNYGQSYIAISADIHLFGKDYGTFIGDIMDLSDSIRFYRSDGVPVEDVFEGYQVEHHGMLTGAETYFDLAANSDFSVIEERISQLQDAGFYMLYTGSDGSSFKVEYTPYTSGL